MLVLFWIKFSIANNKKILQWNKNFYFIERQYYPSYIYIKTILLESINQCIKADKFIVKLCILFLSKSQRKLANTFFNINQYIWKLSTIPSKLKFRLNYKPINYDVKTGMFEVNSEKYSRYEEARANHWRCDKCGNRFSTFKKLRKHKKEIHAY